MIEFVCVALTSLKDLVPAVLIVRTAAEHALLETTSVRSAVRVAMEGQTAGATLS